MDRFLFPIMDGVYSIVMLVILKIYLPFRRTFFRKLLVRKTMAYFKDGCSVTLLNGQTVYIAVDGLEQIDDTTIIDDVTICFRIFEYAPSEEDLNSGRIVSEDGISHFRLKVSQPTKTSGVSHCVFHFGCLRSFEKNLKSFKEFVQQSLENRYLSHVRKTCRG